MEESTTSESSTSPTSRASPKAQPRKHVPLLSESSDDSVEEISTRQSLPTDDEGFEFGSFLLGGGNGPTYVAFEQPEP